MLVRSRVLLYSLVATIYAQIAHAIEMDPKYSKAYYRLAAIVAFELPLADRRMQPGNMLPANLEVQAGYRGFQESARTGSEECTRATTA